MDTNIDNVNVHYPIKEHRIMEAVLERPKHKINISDFKQAEFAYQKYSVTVPVDLDLKELLKPEYWVNVAHILAANPTMKRPAALGTVIEVRNDEHSVYGELYVTGVTKNTMQVEWIREPQYFGPKEAPKSTTHKVRWNLGAKKHEVMRLSDEMIVGAFDQKKEAHDFVRTLK